MCKVYVIVINLEEGGNAAVWSSIFVDLSLYHVRYSIMKKLNTHLMSENLVCLLKISFALNDLWSAIFVSLHHLSGS